ncbi:MAG: glutamate-5-semialdehyde dehydrogenase [Candidatus Brocadiia bacterium]
MSIDEIVVKANEAAESVSTAGTEVKNAVLRRMARLLEENMGEIVAANEKDMARARETGIARSLVNRLAFGESKVRSRIESLEKIAALPDPVGQIGEMEERPNGLMVGRMQVPLGVMLMIYEARPHVTVNAGAFALKSGNAIICKGGSEAENCNAVLGELWQQALEEAGLPGEAIQVLALSHEEVDDLLTREEDIDLVIPRGGEKLIESVSKQSRIPVIKHYAGRCHVYVGRQADPEKALSIVLDSKLLMPAVCNAVETVLVDEDMLDWVPDLVAELTDNGVEVRGCELVQAQALGVEPATEEDWETEYLDKTLSVRVVVGVEEAIEHISRYGSGHTESIVTENYSDARKFMREVDSGVVLVNASTMFCDGESLGMGAEIGISTDKLHARGPMGLEDLTTYKHVIMGEGQILAEPNA